MSSVMVQIELFPALNEIIFVLGELSTTNANYLRGGINSRRALIAATPSESLASRSFNFSFSQSDGDVSISSLNWAVRLSTSTLSPRPYTQKLTWFGLIYHREPTTKQWKTEKQTHTHTHTHLTAYFSGTTHMQVCTSLQTDNQEQSVRYWGDSAKLGTLHPLFDSCFCEQTRN